MRHEKEVGSKTMANCSLSFFSAIAIGVPTFHFPPKRVFSANGPNFHHSILPSFHSYPAEAGFRLAPQHSIIPSFHSSIVELPNCRIIPFLFCQKHSKQTPPFRHRFGFHQSSESSCLFSPSAGTRSSGAWQTDEWPC